MRKFKQKKRIDLQQVRRYYLMFTKLYPIGSRISVWSKGCTYESETKQFSFRFL